jgi:hypothetical protein
MTREEINAFLANEYAEALRYMDNANDALKKTVKENHGHYKDRKYVKSACGIAYLGVLIALDAWLTVKGIPEISKKRRKSIEFYMSHLGKIDKKMVSHMDTVYNILHLDGYYGRETNIKVISLGFELAYQIIDKIKPENPVETAKNKESRANKAKRVWNKMMIAVAVMFS